jgi:hypothetical protein
MRPPQACSVALFNPVGINVGGILFFRMLKHTPVAQLDRATDS